MSEFKYREAYVVKLIDVDNTIINVKSILDFSKPKYTEEIGKDFFKNIMFIDSISDKDKEYYHKYTNIMKIMGYIGNSGELNIRIVYNLGLQKGLLFNDFTYSGKYIVVWKETE